MVHYVDICRANFHNVQRMLALGAFGNLETDFIAFHQAPISVPLDGRIVHEDIGTLTSFDETVTLLIVKPLHFSCRHKNPLKCEGAGLNLLLLVKPLFQKIA